MGKKVGAWKILAVNTLQGDAAQEVYEIQPEDIASMSAELLRLPNRAVPFELAVSSSLE